MAANFCGSMFMNGSQVSHFVSLDHACAHDIIPPLPEHDTPHSVETLASTLLQIAGQSWELRKPKLVISIVGGDEEIEITNRRLLKDKLLPGLMKLAEATDVWFLTEGVSKGIAKEVGAARMQYGAYSPLIGLVTRDKIRGMESMREFFNADNGSVRASYVPRRQREGKGSRPFPYFLEKKTVDINNNRNSAGGQSPVTDEEILLEQRHSHFFLLKGPSDQSDWAGDVVRAFESKLASLVLVSLKDPMPTGGRNPDSLNGESEVNWEGSTRSVDQANSKAKLTTERQILLCKHLNVNILNHEQWMNHRHVEVRADPCDDAQAAVWCDAQAVWWERYLNVEGSSEENGGIPSFEPTATKTVVDISGNLASETTSSCYWFRKKPKAVADLNENAGGPEQDGADEGVPVVIVCFQGEREMAQQMRKAVDRPSPTPILLVKGSGKTADLIADLVLLKYGPRHAHHVEAKTAHQLALEHIMKQLLHFNYADDLSTDVRRGDCYRGCIEKLQAVVNELEDIARKEEANQCPRSPAIASSLAERAEDDDEHPRSEVPSGKQRARDLRGGQYVSNSPEQRRADVDQIQRESDAGAGVGSPSSRRHLMSRQHLVSSQHLASSHHLASMAPTPIAVESTNTKSTLQRQRTILLSHFATPPTPSRLDPDKDLKEQIPLLEFLLPFLRNEVWHKHSQDKHKKKEVQNQTPAQRAREAKHDVQYFLDAVAAAQKDACWVFDKDSDVDFRTAVLRCTINAFGHAEDVLEDLQTTMAKLEKKLKLAVDFNNLDVLKHVIDSSGLRNMNTAKAGKMMNQALQNALTMLRRHAIVHYLVHNGASVDGYDPHSAVPSMREQGRRNWAALLDLIPHATCPRGTVFKEGHTSNTGRKRPFCDSCQECRAELEQSEGQGDGTVPRAPEAVFGLSREKTSKRLMQPEQQAMSRRNESGDATEGGGWWRQCLRRRRNTEDACTDFIRRYERWVRQTVGSSFQYKMALVSPEFDLMVYSVLMNDRQLAFMWWKRYCYPNRAALTICRLYRRLIDQSHMPPSEKKIMRDSAAFFEKLAVEVHRQSRVESHFLSSANVECPMRIWCGLTILDVAVLGECDEFVEECCREEIEHRFGGDLLPYQQFDLGMGVASGCGLKTAVFCHLVFLGIFAPFFMQFNKAPLSDTLRFPTQNIPEDRKLRKNKEFSRPMQIYGEEENFIRRREVEGQGCDYFDAESFQTAWQTWFRGLCMFWQAPVTLFIADAIILLFICLSFTIFLVAISDPAIPEPFTHLSNAAQPETGYIFAYEIVLACYFASRSLSECVQVYVTSKLEYIQDMWNLLDITTVIFFTSGFSIRRICPNNVEYCEGATWYTSGIPLYLLWEHHYSICLFLLWTRLLRVFSCSKNLGPLVILIRHMGRDILKFAVIYAVLLVGFSTLQRGSTPPTLVGGGYQEKCGSGVETLFPVKCWQYWWIIRTFIQATAGELFLDEVTTYGSVGGVILLFVVLNLLMLNLVIAVMSNTYTKVQEAAERQYLMDLYQITNEYSRRSVVAPIPANVFFIIGEVLVFFRYQKLLNLCKLWKGQPARRLFDLHLRRNLPIDELILRQLYTREMNDPPSQASHQPGSKQQRHAELRQEARIALGEKRTNMTSQKLQMDLELAQCWQNKLNSFVERARNALMDKEEFASFLETWNIPDIESAKSPKADAADGPDSTHTRLESVSRSLAPALEPDSSKLQETKLEQLVASLERELKAAKEDKDAERMDPAKALATALSTDIDEFSRKLQTMPREVRDKLRVILARSPEGGALPHHEHGLTDRSRLLENVI